MNNESDKNKWEVNDWNHKLNYEYNWSLDVANSLKDMSEFQTRDNLRKEMKKSTKMFNQRFKGSQMVMHLS